MVVLSNASAATVGKVLLELPLAPLALEVLIECKLFDVLRLF